MVENEKPTNFKILKRISKSSQAQMRYITMVILEVEKSEAPIQLPTSWWKHFIKYIPIRLRSRKGAKAKVTLGRETNAQVAVPTQGSVGMRRSFTHTSPSRSKPLMATGILIGTKPNFNVIANTMRELPVYRNPMWYLEGSHKGTRFYPQ